MWAGFFTVLAIGFLVWMLYRGIRGNPEAFSKDNMNKSLWTLGILALILIGVIGIVVVLLRA